MNEVFLIGWLLLIFCILYFVLIISPIVQLGAHGHGTVPSFLQYKCHPILSKYEPKMVQVSDTQHLIITNFHSTSHVNLDAYRFVLTLYLGRKQGAVFVFSLK